MTLKWNDNETVVEILKIRMLTMTLGDKTQPYTPSHVPLALETIKTALQTVAQPKQLRPQ